MNSFDGSTHCPWCFGTGVARLYGVDVTCACGASLIVGAGDASGADDHLRARPEPIDRRGRR
jgi:hypothetical protein